MNVIKEITNQVESVEGVKLLNVDPGDATNRTVVTFVGEPEAVIEAAFRAIKKAGELIDMRGHHGEHPRIGATDVCPLIPIANVTMEECAEYARKLAEKVRPVFLYIVMRRRHLPLKGETWQCVEPVNMREFRKNCRILSGSLISDHVNIVRMLPVQVFR